MREPSTDTLLGLVSGDAGRAVLDAVLGAVGATLHETTVRSVHRRGDTALAVVHEVTMTDGRGVRLERLYVLHVSTKHVPDGAARVDVDGTVVHVWQFPDDPYMPALRPAVQRTVARALLERLGLAAERAPDVAIRTRSYRPTRRAVVEVRPAPDAPPAAYLKLLGGRDVRRRRRRTRRLAGSHDAFVAAGLPVPPVLDHDEPAGRVTLAAMPGRTLRTALRDEHAALPDPGAVAALVRRLHDVPLAPGGDPDAFADVTRHVELLRGELPERAADLERLAATAGAIGGPRGTVHGDLHDGQLLLGGTGELTGLLDVDGAGIGFLAHDVGRLLAHLESAALTSPQRGLVIEGHVSDIATAFDGHVPAVEVARAAAAAWVGLATGPVRVASPTRREEIEARLDRGLVWADRAR